MLWTFLVVNIKNGKQYMVWGEIVVYENNFNKTNNHLSPQLIEHKQTVMPYDIGIADPAFWHAHTYGCSLWWNCWPLLFNIIEQITYWTPKLHIIPTVALKYKRRYQI